MNKISENKSPEVEDILQHLKRVVYHAVNYVKHLDGSYDQSVNPISNLTDGEAMWAGCLSVDITEEAIVHVNRAGGRIGRETVDQMFTNVSHEDAQRLSDAFVKAFCSNLSPSELMSGRAYAAIKEMRCKRTNLARSYRDKAYKAWADELAGLYSRSMK